MTWSRSIVPTRVSGLLWVTGFSFSEVVCARLISGVDMGTDNPSISVYKHARKDSYLFLRRAPLGNVHPRPMEGLFTSAQKT